MTTTERLMQLAEAWVCAAKRYRDGMGSPDDERDAKNAFRSALSSTLEAPADWQCAECGCRTFARIDVPLDPPCIGRFGPGPYVRCVSCKAESYWPAAPAKAVEAPADVREVALHERLAKALCKETFRIPAEKCPLWQLHLDDARELLPIVHAHGTAQRAAGVEAAAKAVEAMRAKVLDMGRVKVSTIWCASMLKALAASIRPDDGEGTK